MAFWYAAPEYAPGDPLMPSQQSSFRGMRTVVTRQLFMASIEAWSFRPSEMPCPFTHLYSVPERFTPRKATVVPTGSTILLAWTWTPGAAPAVSPDPATRNRELLPVRSRAATTSFRTFSPFLVPRLPRGQPNHYVSSWIGQDADCGQHAPRQGSMRLCVLRPSAATAVIRRCR